MSMCPENGSGVVGRIPNTYLYRESCGMLRLWACGVYLKNSQRVQLNMACYNIQEWIWNWVTSKRIMSGYCVLRSLLSSSHLQTHLDGLIPSHGFSGHPRGSQVCIIPFGCPRPLTFNVSITALVFSSNLFFSAWYHHVSFSRLICPSLYLPHS